MNNLTIQEQLTKLVKALQIRNVYFIDIHSRRLDIGPIANFVQGEVKIDWQQTFADQDPLFLDNASVIFRPKYDFKVSTVHDTKEIFVATMIVTVQFSIENKTDFDEVWQNVEVQNLFKEKQVLRLMWTILRQQLMDCMNRHSLPSIPLPWIV